MKIQISKKLSWIICGLGWMMAIISIIFGENRKIHICAGFFDGTDHVYKIADDTI